MEKSLSAVVDSSLVCRDPASVLDVGSKTKSLFLRHLTDIDGSGKCVSFAVWPISSWLCLVPYPVLLQATTCG